MAEHQSSRVVHTERIQVLNTQDFVQGAYVLYWMQQSQRGEDNHALEYAVEVANHLKLPVVVIFGLTDGYPEANLRHYTFMLEGLRETSRTLKERGIKLSVQLGDPPEVALKAGGKAAMMVCDRGYLRHQKAWRKRVAAEAKCRVVQVESDVIVPVKVVSPKAEYAARTLRPKIHKVVSKYLVPVVPTKVGRSSTDLDLQGVDLKDLECVLKCLDIDRTIPAVSHLFHGGTRQAKTRFQKFLDHKLKHYDDHGNQPQTDDISGMSPYLHFGQVSPLTLAMQTVKSDRRKTKTQNVEAFIEQLIVRRELSMNFVNYTPDYDAYSCIPQWARKTLEDHTADTREHLYTLSQLEACETHDPYWNAAMQEMKHTGFMHNYMRMYWGKKILEWTKTPQEAFQTTLALNNRYFLDGRDPNSYTGVAWIYGVHDRAWAERPIFGKIRYMAATGLERKCDIQGYIRKVERLIPKGNP